jgi:hypothetical protein
MANNWYVIDTAPKDGTRIMLCVHPNPLYTPVVGMWRSFHPNAKGKECWRNDLGMIIHNPTHWMELLPPPAQDTSDDIKLHIFRFIDNLQKRYSGNSFCPADITLSKNGDVLFAKVKDGNGEIILERWILDEFKDSIIY